MRLQELPPPEVCLNPASFLPALLGAAVGKRTRKTGSWGAVGGPEWSRLHLEGSPESGENNSRPSVARASESPARQPFPAPPRSARRRVESRIGDLGEPDAGRTGQGLGALGYPERPAGGGGLVIHSHPRSLRTYPRPSRLRVTGNQQEKAPLLTWRALPLTRTPTIPLFLCFSSRPSADAWRQARKGTGGGTLAATCPARPPRLLPSSESQT